MTDKELLELAAKAAGVDAYWSVTDSIQHYPIFVTECGGRMGDLPYEDEWNPLKDDALALRLAVKLNMGISVPVFKNPRADVIVFRNSAINVIEEGADPFAATRRAIVRAAAEIGRNMK